MDRQGKIELSPEERCSSKDMLSKGRHTSREILRAQIMLKADSGIKKTNIRVQTGVSYGMIFNTLNTYRSKGLHSARHYAPSAGRKPHISPEQRPHITAVIYGAVPEGMNVEFMAFTFIQSPDSKGCKQTGMFHARRF